MEGCPIINEDQLDLFNSPARFLVCGYSNSGKSHLVANILEKYHHKFHIIFYCGVTHHPLKTHPVIGSKLICSETIINPFEEINKFNENQSFLLILDDLIEECVNNKDILKVFIRGRHKNISCILISQNTFFSGKYARSISLNTSHYLLLKQRDLNQIACLGRQIFGKDRAKEFVDIYKRAVSEREFGYLLVDLSSTSRETHQFRTNIVGERTYETVFTWSNF